MQVFLGWEERAIYQVCIVSVWENVKDQAGDDSSGLVCMGSVQLCGKADRIDDLMLVKSYVGSSVDVKYADIKHGNG